MERCASREHNLLFGNGTKTASIEKGSAGSATPPDRAPRLLGPDGEPFRPDPPFGFTKSEAWVADH